MAAASASAVFAQDAVDKEEEVYELSPFEVTSTESSGYDVRDTLAGSRLRSETSDIGAAINIVSRDFLDDLAASNIMEIADFLPSMETESTAVTTSGVPQAFTPTRTRIRGLFTNAVSRNYFTPLQAEQAMPFDGYNLDRITVSAGANSILFGSANPAGLINNSTMPASLGRDTSMLRHRTDNYGSNRFEGAVNRILIEDKFAIRINILDEDKDGWRGNQWQDQERLYGAFVLKLGERTTVNGNIEFMSLARNNAISIVPVNRFGRWTDDGMPTTAIDGVTTPWNSTFGLKPLVWANNMNVVYGSEGSANPLQNRNRYAIGDFNRNGVTNHGNMSVPLDMFDFTPSLMGDFLTGERHAKVGDISIEHKFTENLHTQLSLFSFNQSNDVFYGGPGPNIMVDATDTLADGTPNPDVGRYFMELAWHSSSQFEWDSLKLRSTTSYDLDLRESVKWLGRHQFALMLEEGKGHEYRNNKRVHNTTPLPGYNANIINGQNQIKPLIYFNLDGSTDYGDMPMNWQDLPAYVNGLGIDGVNAQWVNQSAGNSMEGTNGSQLLAVQSHWLNDRLVTTAGYRIDTQDVWNPPTWEFDEDGLHVDYQDLTVKRELTEAVSGIRESSYSMGGVYHLVRDSGPVDLFSLTYNRSNNFQPSSSAPNFQGNPRAFSSGQTIDYGVKARMFDGKLDARVSLYESGQLNARQTAGDTGRVFWPMNTIWTGLADNVDEALRANVLVPDAVNGDTFDIAAQGIEATMTYNPKPQWRIVLMASRNKAVKSNINPSAVQYLEDTLPALLADYGDVTFPGNAEWTVADMVLQMQQQFALTQALDGQSSTEMREWKFSFLTNYKFTEGLLKGFNVGANAVWQDEAAIGYPFADDGSVIISKPFMGDDILRTELSFGYWRKLGDKVSWQIQLNIRNVLDDTKPLAIRADESATINDAPEIYSHRLVEPRSFILTNTFRF